MKKKEKINVFIVDDDETLIEGIAKLFQASQTFTYLDKAAHPEECMEKLKTCLPSIDIILMDVQFPDADIDGIQLAKRIRTLYPGKEPKIAFMTIGDRAIADADKGFYGLIPKNQNFAELAEMLRNIYEDGMVYYPPEKMQDSFFEKLTERQKTIFCQIMHGKEIEYIAQKLGITTHTVLSHQRIILSKIQQSGIDTDGVNHPRIMEIAQKYKLCES